MSSAQRRDRTSAWRADGIVVASLWMLVAILWAGIALGSRVFGAALC